MGLPITLVAFPRHALSNYKHLCEPMQLCRETSFKTCALQVEGPAGVMLGINATNATVPIPGETTSLGISDRIQTNGRSTVTFVEGRSLGRGLHGAGVKRSAY